MLLGKYDGQILAVDFDDTIAFTRFPEILEPNYKVIRFVKLFKLLYSVVLIHFFQQLKI